MAQLSVKAGATSQSINIFIQNSISTVGAGLTGFAPAGGSLLSGMICYYSFTGSGATSVVQALSVPAAVTSAFVAGQIVEIDATHMPGWARLDVPNAALASGNGRLVSINIQGGTNVAQCPVLIELTGWDNQLVPGAAGGLFIAGTNAATTITTSLTTHLVGTVDTVTNLTNAATAGDFTATQKTSLNNATPTASLNLAQTLSAFGSALTSSTADTALTVNEALHCAIASVAGQQTTSGTAYTTKTSYGTTVRAFTLDQNPNPNNRA